MTDPILDALDRAKTHLDRAIRTLDIAMWAAGIGFIVGLTVLAALIVAYVRAT